VYFYTHSLAEEEGIADATRVLGWLDNRHLDLPVVLDVEHANHKKRSRAAANSAMYNAFADRVRRHGYEPMLYTAESFFNNYFDKNVIVDRVWIAKYSANQPKVNRDVAVWQFTSDAWSSDFYKQKLDRNYLMIDGLWGLGEEKNLPEVGAGRRVVLDIMRSWVGCNEKDGTHKQIIDIYNSHKPLARGYKVKYTDAWCATTVGACDIKAGLADIFPTECSCQKLIELYKALGWWVENDAYIPLPGDRVFYDWQDDGVGDNTGWSDHVGVVEEVNGSSITIIEGNYSNAVKRRVLQINGKYIRGYAVPRYPEDVVAVNPYPVPTRNLKRNIVMMTGNDVKWLQWELVSKGFLPSQNDIDGKFGNDTKKAVTAYQTTYGLLVDGIVGKATRYSMLND